MTSLGGVPIDGSASKAPAEDRRRRARPVATELSDDPIVGAVSLHHPLHKRMTHDIIA